MTTGGKITLIEKMEIFAKGGHYGLKTRAWQKEVTRLEDEGVKINIIAHFRPGEISCYIDWSHCSVDLATYSPSDPELTIGNRLWLMAYQAEHPELNIDI